MTSLACFILSLILLLTNHGHAKPNVVSVKLPRQFTVPNKDPSMNAILTPSGIDYLKTVFQPIIIQQIRNVQVDPISQHIDTPIGHCDVSLHDIKMTSFDIKDIDLSLNPGTGLSVKVSNAYAKMHLSWKYKKSHFPKVSDHGTADATVGSNTALTLSATVKPQGNSTTLDITIPNFDMDIFKFDLKMHGGASWLYNLLIKSFKHHIVKGIEKSLHDNVSKIVHKEAQKVLSTLDLDFLVQPGLEADFSFSNFKFVNTGVVSDHLGLIQATGKPSLPDTPPKLPDIYPPTQSDMAQIFIADTSFNSAGLAIQQLDLIKYVIEKDKSMIDTNTLCFLIPKVCNLYPSNHKVQIAIESGSKPSLSLSKKAGVEANLDLAAEFQVLNGTSIDTLFTIDMDIVLDGTMSIANGTTLVGEFTKKSLDLTLKDSEVGQFDVSVLNVIVDKAFDYVLMPLINQVAQKGFILPSAKGLTLVNPSITILDRMLLVSTAFKYTPPSKLCMVEPHRRM